MNRDKRLVVCIKNDGYPASLELRKIYQAYPKKNGPEKSLIRIIDESGEDYLYPENYFVTIDLPRSVESALGL